MKKVISIMLIAVMLLSLMSGMVVAAESGKLVIAADSVTAAPGSTATVTLRVEENPGFAGMIFWPVIKDADGNTVTWTWKATDSNSKLDLDMDAKKTIVFTADKNCNDTGILVEIEFTVGNDVAPGEYTVSFQVDPEDGCLDENFEEVPVEMPTVTITVASEECAHSNTVTEEGKAPTCTEPGYTASEFCKDCQTYLVAPKSISALGHPDENGDGVCDICGAGLHEDPDDLVLSTQSVTVQEARWAKVTLLVEQNPGFEQMSLYPVVTDVDGEPVSWQWKVDTSNTTLGISVSWDAYEIAVMALDNCTEMGILLEVLFFVDENANLGDYTVSFVVGSCENADGNVVEVVLPDTTLTVCAGVPVAQIGDQTFTSLQAAIDAAQEGDTIIMINDYELTTVRISDCHHAYPVYIDVQKKVTIDLNGKKITAAPDMDPPATPGEYGLIAAIYVGGVGELTLLDSVGGGGLIVNTEKDNVYSLITVDSENAKLDIYGGHYELNRTAAQQLIYSHYGPSIDIYGGTYVLGNAKEEQEMPWIFNTYGNGVTQIQVHGGTYNVDPRHKRGDVEIVAIDSKCGLVENEDGTWTVQKHIPGEAVAENVVKGDCLTPGSYESVVYCTGCGQELSREAVTVPAAGEHSFGAWKTLKAATCSESGTRTRECVCGARQTEVMPATGIHTYGEWTETKAATCTEPGEKTSTCDCGHVQTVEIAALGHTEVIDSGKAATCTGTGLTEGKHCSVCGEVLVAQEEIPALSHTEITNPGKAATCTDTGLTEGKHCSVCGEILVAQEEIPAQGHSFGEWSVSKEATRKEAGEKTRSCACGETETQEIPALGGMNPIWIVLIVIVILGAAAVVVYVVLKKKRA